MNFENIIKTEQWIKNRESMFITINQGSSEGYTLLKILYYFEPKFGA